MACVGPLLKSCPELVILRILSSEYCTEEVVTMLASLPFEKLELLKVQTVRTPIDFFPKLFERNWPALNYLVFEDPYSASILPLLSTQSWLTKLEGLRLWKNEDVTADQLRTFLKALDEGGAMESLHLSCLKFPVLKGFKGISLQNLKSLELGDLKEVLNYGYDAGDLINLFFDSCSFPKLEKLHIGDEYVPSGAAAVEGEDGLAVTPKWIRPPRTGLTKLVESFQYLKFTYVSGFDISRDVADYLGKLRGEIGCHLTLDNCQNVLINLSPQRQQLLDKIDLDFEKWRKFRHSHLSIDSFADCVYWNLMDDVQFKRTAYAAVLESVTNLDELFDFIDLCEAEEAGSVMTADVLQSLKAVSNNYLTDYTRWASYTTSIGTVYTNLSNFIVKPLNRLHLLLKFY